MPRSGPDLIPRRDILIPRFDFRGPRLMDLEPVVTGVQRRSMSMTPARACSKTATSETSENLQNFGEDLNNRTDGSLRQSSTTLLFSWHFLLR